MAGILDSWSSDYTYSSDEQIPSLDKRKTVDQIKKENLEAAANETIAKAKKIQKQQQDKKADGRVKRNRTSWNPAKVAVDALKKVGDDTANNIDAALKPISEQVANVGEFADKNLLGIKDTEELAKRRRLRSGDKGERTKSEKEFKDKFNAARKADPITKLVEKPLAETAKFILKSTGPGIIEDYGSRLVTAGQEGIARVGEAMGTPVAPEQDPRSDRYIKAQIDFGLTPDDPLAAGAANILKTINGMRFLGRVGPGKELAANAGAVTKLVRARGLDFFAGFIHADTSEDAGPTIGAQLSEILPESLKWAVPKALTADPDYDSEARYRIITGLEDMGLSQVAEGIGAVFKAIDIFQVAKNAKAKVFGGPKSTADAIDESLAALNKELDLSSYKAELKEAEESLRWDDVRQMQKDQILTKIDDLQARQADPFENQVEIKNQLDNANDELKDLDNTIIEEINGGTPKSRGARAADVGKIDPPESILQNRIWMTDAATKRANMSKGWKALIDEALDKVGDKNNLDALYRRFKASEVSAISKAIDKEAFDYYQGVLDTVQSPTEVRDAMLKAFRAEGETFIGEVGTEQIKTKSILVTAAMIRRLGEKAANIGSDALFAESNGLAGGNQFDRMVDQVTGLVMLRKEAWSLEAGRRLAAGKRWQQVLDETAAEGTQAEAKQGSLTPRMLQQWADYVKDLARSGDPKARDEARQMALALALSGGDPTKVINFTNTLIKYSGKRSLGLFYNNILSAPKTIIRNMAGIIRLVGVPTYVGIQGLIEGNDKLIGAAGAGYAAMFGSSLEAAHVAGVTFKSGVPASWSAASVISKAETKAYLDSLELAADTKVKQMVVGHLRWMDAWVSYTELPSKLMMSTDDFMRTMAVRQKISMDAFNYASNKGAKDFNSFYQHTMTAMSRGIDMKTGQVTDEALKKYGDDITFTGDPGRFARDFEKLVTGDPEKVPVGRFLMPFIRTPANIMAYQTSFTPLIGKFMGGYRQALEAGDELLLAELRGREAAGSLLLSIGYTAGTSGMMTGNAPFDPEEREAWRQQGIQPRSVKIGNKWYSYSWFEPLSNWMAAAADLGTLSRHGEIHEFNKLAETLTYAMAASFTEKSYLANLDGIAVILNPQDAFGQLFGKTNNIPGNANNFVDAAASMGLGAINNMVPYTGARRSWANASDPYYREYDSLVQKTMAQVWPGISKNAPYEPDILTGKPMLRATAGNPNAWIPFESTEENQSPVAQKLIEMNVWHKGNFKTSTTGLRYTGKERAQIKALMAKNGLERSLSQLFNSDEFKTSERISKETNRLTPQQKLVEPWHKRRTAEIFQESLAAAKAEVEATNPDFVKRSTVVLTQQGQQANPFMQFGNP
jgi:hypothetical protein